MNNNQIVSAGVDQVNKGKQNAVISTASSYITAIAAHLRSIKSYEECNEASAKALKELGESMELTYENIVGGAAPTAPNQNQVSILETLKKLNDEKQGAVKAKAASLVSDIESRNAAIARLNKEIAKYREELGKLEVEEVKVEQVVG